ncbi:MAG: hypothetical protein KDD47_05370 [Acidobacteria bacterium]|nr:hypothetical protein [Acidobacteriota bacterium]
MGTVPTQRLTGEGGWAAMVAGVTLGVLAGALSCLPAAMAQAGIGSGGAGNAVVSALGAMALRFAVIAFGGAALALLTALPKVPLLAWIGISYLALLPVETRFLLKTAGARSENGSREIS